MTASSPTPLSVKSTRLERPRNKILRNAQIKKQRQAHKLERKERRRQRKLEREELGDAAPPRQEPITVESARIYDEETGKPLTREEIREITDEFTQTLQGEVIPRVVVTTCMKPSEIALDFIKEWLPMCPGSTYFERHESSMSDFGRAASEKGYTDVLIVKDDHDKLSTLTHIHLPEGPTAVYKISSFVPRRKISGHGRGTRHIPELILNNFSTSLGVRIGRMLGSLFPHRPNFVGRQVVTFHNQRDFIFFRYHRYVFNAKRDKARLQELGPRFTLKLRALQKGIFQHPDKAEHEFKWKTKTDRIRRRFFL